MKYTVNGYWLKSRREGEYDLQGLSGYQAVCVGLRCHAFTGGGFIAPMALSALPEDKKPQAYLQCRSCEQVCPQRIKISEVLAHFSAKLAVEIPGENGSNE